MILTDRQIYEAIKNKDIVIEPFDEKQIQPASYDLRVGAQGATTSAKRLIDISKAGFILLEPGDFGIITVYEELKLSPQHVGRFGLRSKYARKGLIATAGPQIDPGYHGRLIIGITNPTPNTVTIPYKDDLLSVEFHKLEEPALHPYDGPYIGKTELRPEDIEMIIEMETMSMSSVLKTLNSLSQNVGTLTTNVGILTRDMGTFKWVIGLGLGGLSLFICILGIIITVVN